MRKPCVFIRPYTGKEVLYFYLAAGVMKLAGVTPFALRLTSAGLGILNVALTYFLARELSLAARANAKEGRWLAVFSAALVAVSYWQVHLSRFGYRAIVLPPLLALTIGSLLRGLRADRWGWIALAGAWAGLSAYTYSSVRVFPLLLLLLWIWVLVADRHQWKSRLRQLFLFSLAAAVVFAPLGAFFLQHPETFSVRLSQVSVFSPAVNNGDPWGTLIRTLGLALGMFASSGDANPLYNLPGKPIFEGSTALFFLLGLLVSAWRLLSPRACPGGKPGFSGRLPHFLSLTWLVIMMVPNVLSASGAPHNLRAMTLVPVVFIVAALGSIVFARWIAQLVQRMVGLFAWGRRHLHHARAASQWLSAALLIALVATEGVRTWHDYVHVWAPSAAPYYKGNQALIEAAGLLDAHPEADPYVATYFQQHATMAVAAHNYRQIRWMSGRTLVLPPPGASPALLIYDHTNPVDPLLRDRFLSVQTLFHRELGPDGETAFEAYWLSTQKPGFYPQSRGYVNLGHTLAFLGYDLNASPRSGDVLDVNLYFEVLRAVDRDDFALFAHLVDDLGFRWGEETFFSYPSAQWRRGEVLIFRRRLPIVPGAPPGAYALEVGAYSVSLDARLPVLNQAGQMVGTVATVGPIDIERAPASPDERPPIQHPLQVRVGEGLTFLGSDRDRSDLRPGETLALTLYWQATAEIEQDHVVSVWLSGAGGDLSLWRGHPVHGRYPFTQWQADEFVRDRYALRLPLDAPEGDADLRLALLDAEGSPLPTEGDNTSLSLGTIHVRASDRLWEPPTFEHPVGARLGEQVELLGYDLDRDQIQPGKTLHLTLIWRCRAEMGTAYTVFTHLLDPGEQVRGQKDNPPQGGTYPTTLWVPGEVVVDVYQIPVAADAAPGQYVIEVGMYDPATMERLPVLDPTGAIGDRILLADVQVVSGD